MRAEPDAIPVRVVLVTLDHHLAGAAERAGARLRRDLPGLCFNVHAAADWAKDPASLQACKADIARGDIVIATMLFMEDHVRAILPDLLARREGCDAMLGAMSAGEVMKITRLGAFRMDGEAKGFMALLKRLKGSKKPGDVTASSGAKQMAMLRRLPKILRFIPGPAQDVRAYFLVLQYFLAGSEENTVEMVRLLVDRYAAGPRAALRGATKAAPPQEYLEVGLYHPRLPARFTDDLAALPAPVAPKGVVGVLLMRSYLLAQNTAHYDAVIGALEARGLRVIPAFASGLDARPAVQRFFPGVDAVLSLTGFSLVGGPAYSEQGAAEAMLAELDCPCVSAQAVEFQTLEQWEAGAQGLSPVEATMMVAIPELDGSIAPTVFGGRSARAGEAGRDMQPQLERVDTLAARVARLVALRRTPVAEKRVAITLFNFPPNAGDVGTAAYLDVFASLLNVLRGLEADGYATGELPSTVDELRERVAGGNAAKFGAPANVHARVSVDDHVRRELHLREIEAQWGPAPGKHGADGAGLQVWGERFGNVFVGVQPAFGYEGDPMRLLFEGGFAPTHQFSAYYRWLRETFAADALLHFGTHGALEFMPGKQVGLSAACWPDRLIGELPNVYLYAANNPSEGLLAKRRSGAVLVSHMTPPLAQAGLYKGLLDLKGSLDSWRALAPDAGERESLAPVLQAQASTLDLAAAEPAWAAAEVDAQATRLVAALAELEATLIPHGMHVVGQAADPVARASTLAAMAEAAGATLSAETALVLANGGEPEGVDASHAADLRRWAALLAEDHETPGVLRALAGRYVRPAAGGDLVRAPEVLPTG
ncbi:MAG: magnesium chelatase subunit H, partial [Caulobacteraceae bacterium]|nr:magnesium chelatase subunit H [Caulobacter sp.]